MKRVVIAIVAAAGMAWGGPAAARQEGAAVAAAPEQVRDEAARFMEAYGRELLAGDRAAIARRYHRGGAWRVGHGQKSFQDWPAIEAFYAGEHWARPASFAWRDLSYEVLGPDSVVVVGLFDWGRSAGGEPLRLSYTGLLVREDGELRIRLEDESAARD